MSPPELATPVNDDNLVSVAPYGWPAPLGEGTPILGTESSLRRYLFEPESSPLDDGPGHFKSDWTSFEYRVLPKSSSTPVTRAMQVILFGLSISAAVRIVDQGIQSGLDPWFVTYSDELPRRAPMAPAYQAQWFGSTGVFPGPLKTTWVHSRGWTTASRPSEMAVAKAAAMIGEHHATAPEVDAPPTSKDHALGAVRDLQDWLSLSLQGVGALAGLSKSSILYWKRSGADPRPGTVNELHRLHSLLQALVTTYGVGGMRSIVDAPLSDSTHSIVDLWMGGKTKESERALREAIFGKSGKPSKAWRSDEVSWSREVEQTP